MALKKLCPKCGCLISMTEKLCQKCMPKYEQDKKEHNKLYDRRYRDKRSTEFYHSKPWLIVREQIRQRDNGLCKLCLRNKKIRSMDMVHHIEELREKYNKRLGKDNLICLCNKCHNAVHAEYSNGNKASMQEELRRLIDGRGY
ncbi:HNH endonuclease [Clostridium tetani]|uniref:HNH endonuclease n=1 Tax=Clostridium tetani TaxID=1513 RepID=UPI002954889B|nr:HNH endonuclease [Clostridium tetani]BDR84888.1 hypothetical protein K254310026_22990 [Clostridium tetani]